MTIKKTEVPLEEIQETEKKIEVPLDELVVEDISEKKLEQRARAFIMGSEAIGRRKEVRELLEEKVVQRVGKKGKHITDKLFELIEGVYVIDRAKGNGIRYYKVPPNLNAIIYALDRVLGKPGSAKVENEEKQGIRVIESIIKNLASGEIQRKVEIQKTTTV